MAKQLVLLASVTAALGIAIAAGCSTPTLYVVDDDGGLFTSSSGSSGKSSSSSSSSGGTTSSSSSSGSTFDAGVKKDGGGTTGFDSGTSSSGGGTCPTTDPITGADIDAQLQWKAPPAPVNVCTQGNIDALKGLFTSPPAAGIAFADIKTALGSTCSSCVFSAVTGTHWSVFPEDGANDYDNRTGSCFAQVDSAVCGKARFQWETCLNAACSDCADSDFDSCVTTAQSGACSALTTTYVSTCPNEATDMTACGNIYQAIAVTCSGGPGNTINTMP